jgi:hypothetical protein
MAIPGDRAFDAYASDSGNSDREEVDIPLSPPELSDKAETIFKGIKWRTAIHVGKMCDWWRELQDNKHRNPSMDKNGVNRDVGTAVEMDPIHRRGKEVWDIVNGTADIKLCESYDERMQKLIDKLRLASEAYRYEAYCLWVIINNKRDSTKLASTMLWQDVGKLMQLDDAEAKEILRQLREMGNTGQLMSPKLMWDMALTGPQLDDDWYLDHKYPPYYRDPPPKPIPVAPAPPPRTHKPQTPRTGRKRQRAHSQNPNILGNLNLESDSDKDLRRKKKKPRTKDYSYLPEDRDWRCGKCDQWNRKTWGTCHNESCNGTCGEDAVEMHQMQIIM